jgi:hypothetical protein
MAASPPMFCAAAVPAIAIPAPSASAQSVIRCIFIVPLLAVLDSTA